MNCSDFMKTNVECVAPEDSVQQAAAKMRYENVGFLPVCETDRRVVGVLTDRDIVVRLIALGGTASDTVSSIMSDAVVSCAPSTDIDAASQLMRKRNVSRLVCVDAVGHVVGVLSHSDIAEHLDTSGAADSMLRFTESELDVTL